MKIHKFPFAIAYADTDAGGIVYHGRYIEIAERARMDILRGIKFPDGDVGFVVRDLSIRYVHPLFLSDTVIVETAVTKLGAASMSVEQKFVKDGVICAILTGTAAYIGANMMPKRIPDSVAEPFRE
ncbi:MAG TPA: thioesterase family protein [Candidatus Enterousia intestinigallinarum]|uniref:Thioesterase family protein n=1 Tax=Candidatus Enterousia intestinigallinarum TaxID=2840790 RepID=A0A9D1FH53_9PROT|nr:thioesterase family protein [Candidatus Enterousia intestinigallinarum]